MNTKDLLFNLSELETQLNNFSFEELTSKEASQLKGTFNSFKRQLEGKIASKRIACSPDGDKDQYPRYSEGSMKRKHKVADTEGLLFLNALRTLETPLQLIMALTDSMEKSTEANAKRYSEELGHNTGKVMEVVSELLEYSRLSLGMEPFAKVDFDLRAVVKETVFLSNTLILNKDMKVRACIEPTVPKILKGDPSKLVQVLLHLFGNMVHYGTRSEVHLRISTASADKGVHFLTFELMEVGNSVGTASEQHKNFRFGGLRMAIAHKLVENHNGSLAIYGGNNGPTFQMTLPFSQGATAIKNFPKFSVPATNGQLNVLVLSNVPSNDALALWGPKSYVTLNVERALSLCSFIAFDLIVIDLLDPPLNWESMFAGIRNSVNEELGNVQILALTDPTMEGRLQDHGFNGSIALSAEHEKLADKLSILKKHIKMTQKMESSNRNPKGLSSGESPELDMDTVLGECMGDITLLEELIVLYKGNILEFIGNVKYHIGVEDFEQIQFAAHKMKAGLAMMKTFGLHEIVVRMHHTCKTDKDIKYITFLYNCFLEEYPLVEAAIDRAMMKIKD